jgi:GTP cyclohydrolase I
MPVDRVRAQKAVTELLSALGHGPETDLELRQTPALVVDALEREWLCGYSCDIAALLTKGQGSPPSKTAVVVVSNIAIGTLCPHHLLPAEGRATVAYLPGESLLGLGTVARLVEAYSRRLTLQEQIGENVTSALISHAHARAAYCRLELKHACLRLRGPHQTEAVVTTVHTAGEFDTVEGKQRLAEALNQR